MRHLKRVLWVSVLLGAVVVLGGCSALRVASEPAPEATAPRSDGMLVSGRYSTQQGTIHWMMEFNVHPDGTVTHVQSVAGTDKFADFWRERYAQIGTAESDFTFTKEESDGRTVVKATRLFQTVDELNQSGSAQLQLLDSPLFRSVLFKTQTESYDPDSLVSAYASPEQATAEDWAVFLRDAVSVAYVVKDEVTGRTYVWDKTAGEIGGGTSVLIQGKEWHTGAYVGAGAVGIFLSFVLYMGLFGRRHWAPEE